MRCKTCKGAVKFYEGEWAHLADTKCVAVVVEWPEHAIADEDEAA